MRIVRIILLLLVMWVTVIPLSSASEIEYVESPTLLSPSSSYMYITEDTTPTFIFQAKQGIQIEVLEGTEVIGSAIGRGQHPVAVTTASISKGLHHLSYRSVNLVSSQSSEGTLYDVLVYENLLDITDIAPIASSLSREELRDLLSRIQPIHPRTQTLNGPESLYSSWYTIVNNGDLTATLTVGVVDEHGYPINNLTLESFELFINGDSYSSRLTLNHQVAEGVYELIFEPSEPIFGHSYVVVNDVGIGSQYYGDPTKIETVPPVTYNVLANQTFTFPTTVAANLFNGTSTIVDVDWGNPVIDTSVPGTFEFPGTVAGFTQPVYLYLTVTAATDYRIVLTWDDNPSDLDSHLYGSIPSGDFHLYYSNKVYSVNEVTYAQMDQDVTSGYGPETTSIYIHGDVGAFRFAVNKYSGDESLIQSNAVVKLYKGADLLRTFTVPTSGSGNYWSVFQMVGDLLYTDESAYLNRITETNGYELQELFDSRLNAIIYAIHVLEDHANFEQINFVHDIVNAFQEEYHLSQEQLGQYIVNYSSLPSLPNITH